MTDKKNILLWGAAGQAIVLHDFMGHCGYRISAVYDRNPEVQSPFEDLSVFHDESELFEFMAKQNSLHYFSVAIGGDGGRDRLMIHKKLTEKGLKPATLIHPESNVAPSVSIDEGSQILINATLSSRVVIGKEVIVNSSASVDHESVLRDGVHIGPGAVLSGCVDVGSCTFIGSGAVVLPNIRIGQHSLIGAGSVVTEDIPDHVVAYGSPCRVIRKKSDQK